MKIYTQIFALFLLSSLCGIQANAQQVDFELHYNDATSLYEVFAIPDSSNALYFVGGGSQLTLVLPQDLDDVPLQINTVAGGLWSDNSRILQPESDHIHDFHGVASNGSIVNFVEGEALLLFTFELPGGACRSDVRLFENSTDPNSRSKGMEYADFKNFFANVFKPFENGWRNNDNVMNPECIHAPAVASQWMEIEQGASKTICVPIVDPNVGDSFEVQFCVSAIPNGNGEAQLNVEGDELCVTYTPSENFTGTEEFCVKVCDQTGLCNTAMVSVVVVPEVAHSSIAAYADNCENVVEGAIFTPSDFTMFELERSDDGENFQLIEQFESSNQTESQLFNYIDEQIKSDHYYRLRLLLMDGREKYSEVIFVKYDCSVEVNENEFLATITGFADECQNTIDWTINNPTDYVECELQRSDDGQDYEMLNQVESNVELENQFFQFEDNNVKGNHYYRLKFVYADGRVEYSEETFVESDCDMEGELIIYPNPVSHASSILNVKFFAETNDMNLIISDALGRTHRRISLDVEIGSNTIRLDVSDLPTGNYFILMEGKNEITKSFSKIDERF